MGLHCYHLRADFLSKLSSFIRRHRSEEGLHLPHLCFGELWRDGVWAISGIVSFLLASVTCPLYVDSVLPSWCFDRLGGILSVHCPIGYRWGFRQRLAEPGQKCICSDRHAIVDCCGACVFRLFAFVFHSSLPDVLSRPGFDKKLDLMSPLRYESC